MTAEMRAYRGPTRKTRSPKPPKARGGNTGTDGCLTVLALFVVSAAPAIGALGWWLS